MQLGQRSQGRLPQSASVGQWARTLGEQKQEIGELRSELQERIDSLAARMGQATLQRETQAAWVALYRALGGGWEPAANPTDADKTLVRSGEAARAARTAASTPQSEIAIQP